MLSIPLPSVPLRRLAASSDYQKHEEIKKEHHDSVRTLRMTGSRAFDLDTAWLPPEEMDLDEVDGDDDDVELSINGVAGGQGGDGTTSSDDSSDESLVGDERQQQEGLRRGSRHGNKKSRCQEQREIPHGTPNTFAFFETEGAPFLVGKVLEERVVNGEREVSLHWYTPATRSLVNGAATTPFDTYAKQSFTPDFVKDTTTGGSGGSRPKVVPDVSWEQVSSITATCPALIAGGRKIPAWVKQILKGEAADTEDDDVPTAGKGKVSAGTKKRKAPAPAPPPAEEEEEDDEEEEAERGGRGRELHLQQQEAAGQGAALVVEQGAGGVGREQERTGRAPGRLEQPHRGTGEGGGPTSPGQSISARRASKRGCVPRKTWREGSDEDDDRV